MAQDAEDSRWYIYYILSVPTFRSSFSPPFTRLRFRTNPTSHNYHYFWPYNTTMPIDSGWERCCARIGRTFPCCCNNRSSPWTHSRSKPRKKIGRPFKQQPLLIRRMQSVSPLHVVLASKLIEYTHTRLSFVQWHTLCANTEAIIVPLMNRTMQKVCLRTPFSCRNAIKRKLNDARCLSIEVYLGWVTKWLENE